MSANVVWQRLLSFFPEFVKGNSGANPTVDWTKGSVQSLTLNAGAVTPTFVSPPGGCNLALVLTQDGTGGRSVVWPASVSWIGGTPPILLSGAGQVTLVNFYFDGTTYFGSLATAASPQSILPWTDVAPGTTLAASFARPNLSFDTSAAQSSVTFPTAAQMANADGFEFTVKCTGTMVSPVIVNAGAGTTVAQLNVAGTFGASTWLPIQGMSAVFKYDKATTQWKTWTTGDGTLGTGFNAGWYALAVTGIYMDPAGTNGGIDSNSGAVGSPIRTVDEMVRRFGSWKPAVPNGVILQVLSSQATAQDGFAAFNPDCPGGQYQIIGQLTVKVASGQILNGAAVVPKNRAVPNNGQLLEVTFSGGAIGNVAVGDLVVNATHPSSAWLNSNVAGNEWALTQPFLTFQEVDTWAQTDTAQTFSLPKIFANSMTGANLQHVDLDTDGAGCVLSNSTLTECRVSALTSNATSSCTFINCDIPGGQVSKYRAPTVAIYAGQTRGTVYHLGLGSLVTFDVILSNTGPIYANSIILSACYLTAGAQLLLFSGNSSAVAGGAGITGGTSPLLWGAGSAEVSNLLTIPVGAGAPQALFLLQGGLVGAVTMGGGQSVGICPDTTADPVILRGPRNLTATLMDTAVGGGGFRNTSGQMVCKSIALDATIRSGAI